jgi:hypothetical protein
MTNSAYHRNVDTEMNVVLPSDLSVDIEVDLGQTGPAYFLQARLNKGPNAEAVGYLSSGSLELFPIYLSMWIGTSAR